MKKSVFILAMLLMAATAFSQTSRRTANSQKPARKEQTKSTEARSQRTSKKSSFVRKNNNSQNQPANRQSNKSTNTSKRSDKPQATRRTSSGNTTVRRASKESTNGRRTSAGASTERNTQAQSTVRRTHVNVTSNRSRNNATTNRNQSAQTTQHHSQGHRSAKINTGTKYVTYYRSPRLYHGTRVVRYHYKRTPRSRIYRARHYPYRVPLHLDIYWTNAMRREYVRIYPMVSTWRYPAGYRIQTISAYDAMLYHGEVMNVYGKVHEVFYSRETDEYMLYFGAYFPYHDLSVVVPGWIARRMSRWPAEYFERQHVIVTGLITSFEDKPEIVVRNTGQLRIY